jgi:AAA+ ATPase superfamily predicted ATPase
MNPFNYDKLVSLDEFCGREQELRKVADIIKGKNNVLMYGDRRYGKTSLIKKTFSQLPKTIFTVYVDLYDIVDEMDFAQSLYNAVLDEMPFSLEEKFLKFGEIFKRLNGVSLTPTKTFEGMSLKPDIRGLDFDELIEAAFDGLSRLCERNKYTHVVLALDEFQQIKEVTNVKIDAKLRKISQNNSNICFIFSGSKRNMLRTLVSNQGSPFYGMTTPLVIKGIKVSDIQTYCEKKLGAKFIENSFEYLYDEVRGQTRLLLQLCYRLHSDQIKKCGMKKAKHVLAGLIEDYDDEFRERFMRFPNGQKKVFKGIVLSKGKKLFSNNVLKEISASKQSLNQAVSALEKQDEITKTGEGSYQINDVLFQLWLSR